MTVEDLDRAYADIYAAIPTFACKDGCNACCGPMPYRTPWEADRMPKVLVADAYACPHKTPQGCAAYDTRPFTCRLFGNAEGFECRHAGPEQLMTREAGRSLKVAYFKLAIRRKQ